MAHQIDTNKPVSETRLMFGRRVIKSSVKEVNSGNVVEVLSDAMITHDLNRSEINYLWEYYKGNQPVLNRVKEVRPEICNKLVENRANEIVSFKVGYLCGEPIQYVSRRGDESTSDTVERLNDFMYSEDKTSQDQEIVEWQMICGTAFRLVLPRKDESDDSPFEMYTLDPRDTFVVYSNEIGNKPLMAVKYSYDEETNITTYTVYTEYYYFLIEDSLIKEARPHALGCVPIFEYPANNARLGSFEIVLPLLDAINNIESNRLDGVEQTIQAFLKFINCDIDKEGLDQLKELGAIKVKSVDGARADVGVVSNDLDQNQTQTLKDDCYSAILTICGMPNRHGGKSSSDTGAAVVLRDGWSMAEARAKDSEHIFKRSEKKALKLILKICRELTDVNLKVSDVEIKFTRRNYEDIQSKSNVLISMLDNPKVHPLLAFQHSGMFSDAESAYQMSMEYFEAERAREEAKMVQGADGSLDSSEKSITNAN